jgi:hypothetical protein
MEQAPFVVTDGVPNLAAMKKTSFLVTDSIPGIAAKDEIIRVNENGILIGRWLPLGKYPQLVKSRHLLRVFSQSHYSPPARPLRQPRV